MFVLARQAAPVKRITAAPTGKLRTFLAPRRGWICNEATAKPKAEGAVVFDNAFPTTTGVRVRRGSSRHATVGTEIGAAHTSVGALMSYRDGPVEKLFAATTSRIYDVTSPADPLISPAAVVEDLGSSDWSTAQIANSDGDVFLRAVNGVNEPLLFNGTTWVTTPAITDVTANDLSYVWSFKKRLFFIEKGTLNAWYLSIDAIGGAASKLPLGGVFRLGGELLFGATWSLDSGTGLAETCVFVTTEGEVAIYQGVDPSSADGWSLNGVYRIGRPLGKHAHLKAGGDLAIATDAGLVPISQAVQRDQAALRQVALSSPIEPEWIAAASTRQIVAGWQALLWPTETMLVISMPGTASQDRQVFVANATTGAWARYVGWDVLCLGMFNNRLFFGTRDGGIIEGEVGGSDQGTPYTMALVGLFEDLGSPGVYKSAQLARATFLTAYNIAPRLSIGVDYVPTLPTVPTTAPDETGVALWDAGIWNVDVWSGNPVKHRAANWVSVTGGGYALAPQVQLTVGSAIAPDFELVSIDLQFESGEAVV